jgi:hypothetical protein
LPELTKIAAGLAAAGLLTGIGLAAAGVLPGS